MNLGLLSDGFTGVQTKVPDGRDSDRAFNRTGVKCLNGSLSTLLTLVHLLLQTGVDTSVLGWRDSLDPLPSFPSNRDSSLLRSFAVRDTMR